MQSQFVYESQKPTLFTSVITSYLRSLVFQPVRLSDVTYRSTQLLGHAQPRLLVWLYLSPIASSSTMAKVHTSNKRPRIEDSTRPKATPEFYQDFPEVSGIGVTTLIKSRLPLTFLEWPDYIQSGLVVSVLPLMRDTPDPEARALITRYWEVRLAE